MFFYRVLAPFIFLFAFHLRILRIHGQICFSPFIPSLKKTTGKKGLILVVEIDNFWRFLGFGLILTTLEKYD